MFQSLLPPPSPSCQIGNCLRISFSATEYKKYLIFFLILDGKISECWDNLKPSTHCWCLFEMLSLQVEKTQVAWPTWDHVWFYSLSKCLDLGNFWCQCSKILGLQSTWWALTFPPGHRMVAGIPSITAIFKARSHAEGANPWCLSHLSGKESRASSPAGIWFDLIMWSAQPTSLFGLPDCAISWVCRAPVASHSFPVLGDPSPSSREEPTPQIPSMPARHICLITIIFLKQKVIWLTQQFNRKLTQVAKC